MKNGVIKELQKILTNNVIFKADEPTDFANSLVLVQKPNKPVSICVDTNQNRAIKCQDHLLPNIESITAKILNARVLRIFDAHKGFW